MILLEIDPHGVVVVPHEGDAPGAISLILILATKLASSLAMLPVAQNAARALLLKDLIIPRM
jgi:hypothetical protein